MLPTASLSLPPHLSLNASIHTVSHLSTTGARLPEEAFPTPPCSHVSATCSTSFAARFTAMMRRTLFISLKGVGNTSCKHRYHHLTIKHHAAIRCHSRPRGAVMRKPACQDRSFTRLNVPQQHLPLPTSHRTPITTIFSSAFSLTSAFQVRLAAQPSTMQPRAQST